MNKEIEKIESIKITPELLEMYIKSGEIQHATNLMFTLKLNELIEVVNSLIKDEEENKTKSKQ